MNVEQTRAAFIASTEKDRILDVVESAVLEAVLPHVPPVGRAAAETAVRAAMAQVRELLDRPVQIEAGTTVITDHRQG